MRIDLLSAELFDPAQVLTVRFVQQFIEHLSVFLHRDSFGPHRCRRSIRRILPLIVLGSSVTNSISRGYLYGAVRRRQCSWSSSLSGSLGANARSSTTKALTI